mgnify:CR=1|jgi:hypothetical protein|tara:strand:- start:763 stop:1110 length:348 start_codon:yes stop_codon:yes gene_type:complete
MSVFVNKKVDLTSDATFTLYTVPSATTAIIKSILVSDDSGSGSALTVTLTDTSNAVFSIVYQRDVPADAATGPVDLLTNPLIAEAGEIIKVSATTGNRLHVILSAMEVTPRAVVT